EHCGPGAGEAGGHSGSVQCPGWPSHARTLNGVVNDSRRPGQSTVDLDNMPREECGVFGVWAPGEDVAKMTYFGIYALQHRGQEAAGIAVGDRRQVLVFKDLGLVSQVFDELTLSSLCGHVAIGHTRYSTTGSTTWENAQPTFRPIGAGGNASGDGVSVGTGIALGHNGSLVNLTELLAKSFETGRFRTPGGSDGKLPMVCTTDSDLICELIASAAADTGIEQAAYGLLPTLSGAF